MRILLLIPVVAALTLGACAPQAPATTPPPTTPPPAPAETQTPSGLASTEVAPATKTYSNSDFGLAFQYPSVWFGPEEYVSGGTLRVEVGSDKVYPYGEVPDQPSNVRDSYDVVVQCDKGAGAPPEIYDTLENLQDGESSSDARSLMTRVRAIELGRFTGFEYIFTLPEGAQTDHLYGRQVVLFDEATGDRLSVMGQPINVEVSEGEDWREAYRNVDEANLPLFEAIVASMTAE